MQYYLMNTKEKEKERSGSILPFCALKTVFFHILPVFADRSYPWSQLSSLVSKCCSAEGRNHFHPFMPPYASPPILMAVFLHGFCNPRNYHSIGLEELSEMRGARGNSLCLVPTHSRILPNVLSVNWCVC